ncbi:MAG: hypothetical protein ACRDRN_24825 [Sciscionella sp.]
MSGSGSGDRRGQARQVAARLEESPGRALGLAVVSTVMCMVGVVMVVIGLDQGHHPGWYQVLFPVLMAIVAAINWPRFVSNRRKAADRS